MPCPVPPCVGRGAWREPGWPCQLAVVLQQSFWDVVKNAVESIACLARRRGTIPNPPWPGPAGPACLRPPLPARRCSPGLPCAGPPPAPAFPSTHRESIAFVELSPYAKGDPTSFPKSLRGPLDVLPYTPARATHSRATSPAKCARPLGIPCSCLWLRYHCLAMSYLL